MRVARRLWPGGTTLAPEAFALAGCLPDESQPELRCPAVVGGGDRADGRVRDVQIRVAEIRVIQQVEHFKAEFDARLVDREPLAQRRVDALGARPADRI